MTPEAPGAEASPPALQVPVHCAFTEMRPLETLVENPRNPNKHPEAQIKLLGRVIAGAGWRSPIGLDSAQVNPPHALAPSDARALARLARVLPA